MNGSKQQHPNGIIKVYRYDCVMSDDVFDDADDDEGHTNTLTQA